VITKHCVDCGIVKPLGLFALHRKDGDRRRPHCKPCGVLRTALWQAENRERKNVNGLRWFHEHNKEVLARQRKRRKLPEIRAKDRAYQKQYRKEHPETTSRLWRQRWRARHPELVKELSRVRSKRRSARLRGAGGNTTAEQLRARIAFYGGLCWMCKAVGSEIDHVKPVAKGGAHLPCNLRPICGKCNRKKSDTWPITKAV
jgi:5-methylcytosine-specific restriction endonuclease McrA